MKKILLVEDNKGITEGLCDIFTQPEYKLYTAKNIKEAGELLSQDSPDLVLLDVGLPDGDGFEFYKKHLAKHGLAVIFLTAKDEENDIVKGLELGAEDYITKPFEMLEVQARIETVLRRYHKMEDKIEIFDTTIDLSSRTVMQGGKQIMLTWKEFELLLFFVRNKNIALYRETIYENIWDSDYMGDSRTVDLHVQRLRKKLNWGDKIQSVYKVGYRLEV